MSYPSARPDLLFEPACAVPDERGLAAIRFHPDASGYSPEPVVCCRSHLRFFYHNDVAETGGRVKPRLKVLSAERAWTQADLAEAMNVTRQTVHAIEKGNYDPSLPLAFKTAEVFGTPLEQGFFPSEGA